MINVAELARRLGSVVMPAGESRSAGRVTADDVRRYLRPHAVPGAAMLELGCSTVAIEEIERVVAVLPLVVVEERLQRKHPGFRRYFDALPRILFFYGRGDSADDIASEMNFVATGFGVETVMALVAEAVAKRASRR